MDVFFITKYNKCRKLFAIFILSERKAVIFSNGFKKQLMNKTFKRIYILV